MSVRTDNANLIITIDAKESVEYQKAVQRSAELTRNIKKMEVGTDEYNAALKEQAEISKRLGDTDYTKLSLKNLADRKKALQDQIRILPQAQAAELGLERELQRVNTALSENARRTRATSQEMNKGSIGVKSFLAAYVGIGALQSFGFQLFEQIKRINSLNAAYKLLIPETDKRARADAFLAKLANNYGLEISALRDEYIKYNASAKASTLALKDQELVFESVAKAGAVLGLSNETQSRAFTALQQIMSKGKVSAEELKGQLGDALPGAVTIMAKALGVGTGELQKMLEKGEVMADEALPKFAIELQKAYGVDQVSTIENLSAAQNRAANTYTQLVTVIGEKVGPLFTRLFDGISETTKKLTEFISPTKTAAQETKLLQNEFNNEIGVLKRLAPEAEGRKEIIDQINIKYKDYLPNLIQESDSIDAITKAQKLANDAFEQKILLLVLEENLEKIREKRLRAERQKQGAAVSRARTQQENEVLGNIGATPAQLEAQKKINEQFIDGTIEGADRLIDEATKDEQDYMKAAESRAEQLGSTLQKIRERFAEKEESTGGAIGGGGGESEKSKKAREKAEKDAENALKKKREQQQKERDALLAVNFYDPKLAEAALQARLKQLEDLEKREQLILQENYAKGLITEDQYNVDKLRLTSSKLAERIALLDLYGNTETDQRKELNIALLNAERDLLDARAGLIVGDGADLTDVKQQYIDRIISEEEFSLQKLDIERAFIEEKMLLLQEAGLIETDTYKKLQDDLIKIQDDTNKKKEDNEKRSAKMREEIQKEAFGVSSDILDLGIELLGKDEAARKKNASAIRAFESAKVLVNSVSEIASIWKGFTETLGPIAGPIFAAIRTVFVAARAGQAIGKINAQQFYGSGQVLPYSLTGSQRINVSPNIPTQRGGDNVLAMVKPGEVILNEDHQAKAGGPSFFASLGVPGFEGGGIVRLPNTVPTGLTSSTLGRAASDQAAVQADPRIDMLVNALTGFTQMFPAAVSNIKANVNYFDIENKSSEINEIRDLARI
jgi:tape measure domain-containing protein